MAPFGQTNPPMGTDFSAEQLNAVPLPPSLLCSDCHVEKAISSFSKRHQRDYRFQRCRDHSFVPSRHNSSFRCRNCSGEQVHELQCEGPCGFVKVLDCFSKSQRTKGEKWCKDCVLWKLSQEPGGEVADLSSDPTPEDDDDLASVTTMGYDGETSSILTARLPTSSLSGFLDPGVQNATGPVAPHVRGVRAPVNVPLHLRAPGAPSTARSSIDSVSSASNPYEQSTTASSRAPPVPTPARSPPAAVPAHPMQRPNNSNWARADGTRNVPQAVIPRQTAPVRQASYYSDGESADEP